MKCNTVPNENTDRAFETVTELELAAVKRDREVLKDLKAKCAELVEDLRKREQEIVERIEAGAFVMGEAWVITRRRQNISWLTVVKRKLGEQAVLETRNTWPTTFYKELRVG
jgi:hypothetical protein